MKHGINWRYVVGGLLVLSLWGCNPLGGAPIQQRGYLLQQPTVQAVKKPLVGRILVQPVNVNPAFAGQLFVKYLPDDQYARDYQSIFFVPPGQQLTEIMYQTLSSANLSDEVVTYGVPQRGLALRSEVRQLYIDESQAGLEGASSPAVVMDWSIKLYRIDRLYHQRWVRTLHYHQKVPMKGLAIDAMNVALRHTMRALVRDLQVYLQAHPWPVAVNALLNERLSIEREGSLDRRQQAVLASQLSRT